MTYEDFKYLPKGTASDNALSDKVFDIAKKSKYDEYQGGLVSIVYKVFGKTFASHTDKPTASGGVIDMWNGQSAKELPKLFIRKIKKRQVYPSFKDNIWGADFSYMQLIIVHSW